MTVLFKKLFEFFAELVIGVFMLSLVWISLQAFNSVGSINNRIVNLQILYDPAEYGVATIVFLELHYQGIPMKKIINAVAVQGSRQVYVEGKIIDSKIASENLLKNIIPAKNVFLKISNPEIIITGSPDRLENLQKISVPINTFDKETAHLELYVG